MDKCNIDFITIVLNGEPFIEHCISQYYKYSNKIIIVEGADNRTRDHVSKEFFTEDGHSIDNTREIIHSFPDPEKKITIIEKDGFWNGGKDEMFSATEKFISSQWVFEVDCDEFYKDEDMEKIFEIIEENPQATGFCFPWRNFWHNFHTIYGWENMNTFRTLWGEAGWRLLRWQPGFSKWITHRPPTTSLRNGNSQTNAIGPKYLASENIFTYHYSDLLPKQNLFKSQYYEIPNWYNNIFMKWLTNKEEVENYGIYPLGGSGKTMEYNGTHPSEIYKLAKKLNLEIK